MIIEFVDNKNKSDLVKCFSLFEETTCKEYCTLMDLANGRVDDSLEWRIDLIDKLIEEVEDKNNKIEIVKAYTIESDKIFAMAIIKYDLKVKYLEILDIIINEHYQKMGIGKDIIEYIENFAKEMKIKNIGLSSSIKNVKAHIFFEKNGYEIFGYEYRKII
ncbi:MAG: GNAT family N-acetyltransferase [Mobilitalea sp.]